MSKCCIIRGKKLPIVTVLIVFLLLSGMCLAEDGPIGTVTEFSGEVLLRSQGIWGGEMVAGLPVFSGDKIVTTDGTVEVAFKDGSRLMLCRYSALELKQWTRRGLPIIQSDLTRRRFTLYMGKMWIETDYRLMRSEIATPPMVSGLREDSGTTRIAALVSVNQKGEAFLSFDEGDRSFTIGPWKAGVADNVPPREATNSEFIKGALVANIAALVAQRANDATLEEDAAEQTRKLAWIRANKAAAEETRYCAAFLELWTPDKQILADARENLRQAKTRLKAMIEAEASALEAGASEDDWAKLNQEELDVREGQRAIAGVDAGDIGAIESSGDRPASSAQMEDLGMPKPGAFANRNPCE
ncbi:MAG: hypothetical protein JEZ02_15065 [Desulfatibacillum sp.]|nr:hypothetical protein [Desulfatibacillum sp.]